MSCSHSLRLPAVGQLAVHQQIRRLQERALLSQLFDGIAAIHAGRRWSPSMYVMRLVQDAVFRKAGSYTTSPCSSPLSLICAKDVARTAPFSMGISYVLPVRLSVIVRLSGMPRVWQAGEASHRGAGARLRRHALGGCVIVSQQVVIVRHGETEWSREGRHTGRTDVPLTAEGERQARGLGHVLRRWRFAAVYSSPLQRARRTCGLAGYSEQEVTDADLAEWDYGDYDGLTLRQIRERLPGWILWRDGVPGGEPIDEVAARADRVISRARSVDGDVLLVAHGHLLRILAARWIEQPPELGQRFWLGPAAPSVLGYEHEWTVIRAWGSAPAETIGARGEHPARLGDRGADARSTAPAHELQMASLRARRAPRIRCGDGLRARPAGARRDRQGCGPRRHGLRLPRDGRRCSVLWLRGFLVRVERGSRQRLARSRRDGRRAGGAAARRRTR